MAAKVVQKQRRRTTARGAGRITRIRSSEDNTDKLRRTSEYVLVG